MTKRSFKKKKQMPRTEEQYELIRQEKKQLICQAALELFASKGYHSTSISLIAKEAKISKGLMYNYFKGKEDLLQTIFVDLIETVMSRFAIDKEGHISETEAESFIDKLFDGVIENPKDWKFFYQLMMQQEVLEIMMKENLMDKFIVAQKVMFNYFADREFQDPIIAIMHFSSIYKGFCLQYALAPEMFGNDEIKRFKILLRDFFVKPLRTDDSKRIELTESIGYMLL